MSLRVHIENHGVKQWSSTLFFPWKSDVAQGWFNAETLLLWAVTKIVLLYQHYSGCVSGPLRHADAKERIFPPKVL